MGSRKRILSGPYFPENRVLIVLFTDFGARDLYVGQVKAILAARAPRVPVIDALHDAPDFDIEPAAHLLAALCEEFPRSSVFLAVVDPGVGGKRDAIVVEADGRAFVGPDNGLLSILWQRTRNRKCWRIAWRPERLSPSFHGRDLFAPLAAALAVKRVPRGWLAAKRAPEVRLLNEELARIIYIDHYGNAVTGLREFKNSWRLRAGGRALAYARTFEKAATPFWYENSMGLVEIAAPRGSAARLLRLKIGSPVAWQRSTR
jgi:S-adenosylmethionine hydrolase